MKSTMNATHAAQSSHLGRLPRLLSEMFRSTRFIGTAAIAASLPFGMVSARAADYTVSTATTAAKTLIAGQTGSVTDTGSVTVSGSAVAVTVSGNNATLNNLGTIKQTGTGRVVRDNTGVTGLVINNGSTNNASALMQSTGADVVQMNVSPASVTLNNYGSMKSLNTAGGGNQVVDFTAILSGSNTVNNFATGSMTASEADAVRTGVNGVVNNWGLIKSTTTTGTSSDGIDMQSNAGASITNYGGTIDGARHGITGGAADSTVSFTTGITNLVGATIRGNNGSGINLDGFNAKQIATIFNSGTITGNGITGDGDGIDVDGLVHITNTGLIRSINSFSALAGSTAFSEGITVGGGSITNSGTIEGLVSSGNSNAVGRGITLSGNDITSGLLAGTREGIYGNAVVTNQAGGLIQGQYDAAIVATGARSGFSVTIHNEAGGTIRAGAVRDGSSSFAAIVTGMDDTIIRNAGLIDGSSTGKAIAMGSGNNALYITGGTSSIRGSISGGTGGTNAMVINPGSGNSFSYAGSISNFNSVEVLSGNVSLSGVNSYTGTTRLSGGTLTLDGVNRVDAGSALDLNGGTLKITNAAGLNGQTFASLSLSENATLDLGSSTLTFNGLGTIGNGKTLTILNAAAGSYAYKLLGNYSGDAAFARLLSGTTVNGFAANYRFDGTYTDVSAVPEPESYALLLAGLGLVATMVRRRQRRPS